MYNLRYYAIGHSYLKHGPFEGWQTEGFWGMAASEPSNDYYHTLKSILKENLNCQIQSVAENRADYERLCTENVTENDYKNSLPYKHMQDVIRNFKPNLITVFVGGGNTVANDKKSLTTFFDILFDMIKSNKQPETVVVFVFVHDFIRGIAEPIVKKYGFTVADATFIHKDKTRDNPYYAFGAYPEYDEKAASGAIEFRTHPGNLGHRKIAECIFEAVKEEIIRKIPNESADVADNINSCYNDEDLNESLCTSFPNVNPKMDLTFGGFNVTFTDKSAKISSAPGTGACVAASNLSFSATYNTFYADMTVSCAESYDDKIELSVFSDGKETKLYLPLIKNQRHMYQFDISDVCGTINSFKLTPHSSNCFIELNSIGFSL